MLGQLWNLLNPVDLFEFIKWSCKLGFLDRSWWFSEWTGKKTKQLKLIPQSKVSHCQRVGHITEQDLSKDVELNSHSWMYFIKVWGVERIYSWMQFGCRRIQTVKFFQMHYYFKLLLTHHQHRQLSCFRC